MCIFIFVKKEIYLYLFPLLNYKLHLFILIALVLCDRVIFPYLSKVYYIQNIFKIYLKYTIFKGKLTKNYSAVLI